MSRVFQLRNTVGVHFTLREPNQFSFLKLQKPEFWKVIKSSSGHVQTSDLPNFIVKDSRTMTDNILSQLVFYLNLYTLNWHHRRTVDLQSTFSAFYLSVLEVQKALKNLDTKKAAGPDKLDPFSLKLAADFISELLSHIFNLSNISY